MTRHALSSFVLLLSILLPLLLGAASGEVGRPNIVVIIGDDHSYSDAGFMGSEIAQTPHLDRLASEGTVFTTAYNTSSVCRASLLSLMTGLQPLQTEAWLVRQTPGAVQRRADYIGNLDTLPGLLAGRGYRSFQAGKHWEGAWRRAGFSGGTRGRAIRGNQVVRASGGRAGLRIGRGTMQPVWDFLRAKPREPFLLWFAPQLPHIPTNAPDAIRARYDGSELSASALDYYANVSWLDDGVGAIMKELEALDVLDRTLVVYVSDNGWSSEVNQVTAQESEAETRGKMSMRELGFRTPLIFRWPGRVPAGIVREELVSTLDVFPTLLSFAGLTAPPGREGIDLRAAIEGSAPPPQRTIYGHMDGALPSSTEPALVNKGLRRRAFFARDRRWHFIHIASTPGQPFGVEEQLYDVLADPAERDDVRTENPDVVSEFRQQIRAWQQRMLSTLPIEVWGRGEWSDPTDRRSHRD